MNLANKVSVFRILSVPFFIATILYYSPEKDFLRFIAVGIFLLAVVSDAIDGYIARKTKTKTSAGLVLDPLADKLLLISAFALLTAVQNLPQGIHFPIWATIIVISRDMIILLGALVIFIIRTKIDVHPSRWGKVSTAFQMAAVISVLLQWSFSWCLWTAAALLTVVSGVDYIRRGVALVYAVDTLRNNQ